MKRLLLLLIALISFLSSSSQKIEWGQEYPLPKGMFKSLYSIGHSDEHYYVVSQKGKNQVILRFDYDHRLDGTQPVTAEYNDKKLMVTDMIETAAGSFGLSQQYIKKEKKNVAYAFRLEEDGKLERKGRELFALPYTRGAVVGIGPFLINANVNGDLQGYVTSPDKKLVAFVNPFSSHDDKNVKDKMSLNIFDENLNEVSSHIVTFPYSDDDVNLTNFTIVDNGDVYFLGPKWGEKKDREKGIPNFTYHVFRVRHGEIDLEVEVEHPDMGATQATVFVDGGSIYVIGFYTDKAEKFISDHGTFLAKFNESGEQEYMNVDPFTDEVKDTFTSERRQEKGIGVGSLSIDHAVYNQSLGTVSFVAEQYYVTTSQYLDGNGNWQTRYHYHSNEIIVPGYDVNKQERTFLTLVNKSYETTSWPNSSYVYSLDKETGIIHLVFNDFKTKSEREEIKGSKKAKGRYTDLVSIDVDGNVIYNGTLFTSKETDNYFLTRKSTSLGNGEVLLYSQGKKVYQFGILTLPGG